MTDKVMTLGHAAATDGFCHNTSCTARTVYANLILSRPG